MMRRVVQSLLFVTAFAVSAFAQFDTAYVPVTVTNTAAQVKIVPPAGVNGFGDSVVVQPNQQATLKLRVPTNVSITHSARNLSNAQASASYERGRVALELHPRTFRDARVSLFSVSGKRVLRGNAVRRGEGANISRSNVTQGVYLLSVKGADGDSFTYRFAHGGGKLDIRVAFAAEDNVMRRAAEFSGNWLLTASQGAIMSPAAFADTSYTITPVKGYDNPQQTITLRALEGGGDDWVSALEFFRSRNNGTGTRLGWNLGNTLDAVRNNNRPLDQYIAEEGAWGTPAATRTLINGIAAQGVDLVRIGVSYVGHIGGAPNYTISPTRLNRVQEVVDWVLDAGMIAIINIHHDGNYTQPNVGTWGFLKFAEAINNPSLNQQIQVQIDSVWTQIANRFKDYGPELIFETFNELHAGDWGGGNNQTHQQQLFQWNTAALNAIRRTGGNNAKRYVGVPGLGSTEPAYVISSHSRNLLLPNDGANGTDRLIVSVHFYAPWRFTVAGVIATQGEELVHTISQTELNHIASAATSIKTTFIDNGIAAYYGEWGAPTRTRAQPSAGGVTMTSAIRDAHVDYISRVANNAVQNGIVPIIWDDGGNFQMIDRANGNPATSIWNSEEERMFQSDFPTRVWNAYKQAVGK